MKLYGKCEKGFIKRFRTHGDECEPCVKSDAELSAKRGSRDEACGNVAGTAQVIALN